MNCDDNMETSPKKLNISKIKELWRTPVSPGLCIATDVNLLVYLWFTNSYFPEILHCF